MSSTDLSSTDLSSTNLSSKDLSSTNLSSTDLSSTDLSKLNLNSASGPLSNSTCTTEIQVYPRESRKHISLTFFKETWWSNYLSNTVGLLFFITITFNPDINRSESDHDKQLNMLFSFKVEELTQQVTNEFLVLV